MTAATMTIRLAGLEDTREIRRLAGLDSAPVPRDPALVATENERIVAVVSLRDGSEAADPFRSTAAARALLRLRAEQIAGSPAQAYSI